MDTISSPSLGHRSITRSECLVGQGNNWTIGRREALGVVATIAAKGVEHGNAH